MNQESRNNSQSELAGMSNFAQSHQLLPGRLPKPQASKN
jgi:hypothetical protein